MGFKRLILTAVPVLFASMLMAQNEAWTLNRCIDYALEHNIGVQRMDLTAEMAQADLTGSKLGVLPDLNGVVEHQLGSGRVLDRGTYEWYNTSVSQGDLGVQSTMYLFEGFQRLNSIRRDQALYRKSLSEAEAYRDDITLDVMTAYLDLLLKTELVRIAEGKLEVVGMQVERMERLVELGTQKPGELLTLKSQYSNEFLNLTKARNICNGANLTLIHLMNLPLSDSFQVARPDMLTPENQGFPRLDSVFSVAVNTIPHIKSAEWNMVAMKKNLAVAQGQRSPSFYVRGLYYTNYSNKLPNPVDGTFDYPLFKQLTDNQYRQVSIGMSVPIFNRWQTQTSISRARIRYLDASLTLEESKQNLLKNIQSYYSEALAARDNYRAGLELVASSKEAFDYAEEKFRLGLANALELEEARNKLFESQSQLATSRYVFIFYIKILDYFQGKAMDL